MYGFGGVGQVEVRFGQMSPWRDERTTEQPNKERWSYSANGPWKAEMSNDQSEAHSDRGFIVDKIFIVYALCFT